MRANTRRTRRQARAKAQSSGPSLDISSLIDVAFLLLIYFLVTSSLQQKETDLPLRLGSVWPIDNTTQETLCPVDFRIFADGSIALNEEIVAQAGSGRELPLLNERLEDLTKLSNAVGQIPVAMVEADNAAVHQRLVDLVNALHNHGVETVAMGGFSD